MGQIFHQIQRLLTINPFSHARNLRPTPSPTCQNILIRVINLPNPHHLSPSQQFRSPNRHNSYQHLRRHAPTSQHPDHPILLDPSQWRSRVLFYLKKFRFPIDKSRLNENYLIKITNYTIDKFIEYEKKIKSNE